MPKETTEFHRILKHCREKMGLSQAQISKNIGIAKPTNSAIEANKRPVPRRMYDELDKHINFEQFELKEALLEQLEDEMEQMTTYQLLCLVWKLQNLEKEEK